MEKEAKRYMEEAFKLARENMELLQGGPFGAVVVKNGKIIGSGSNSVISENDPTCHAEVVAIREACEKLKTYHLHGCTIYSSCEPCPMCLGAIYWAHIDQLYYASTRDDAAEVGFADKLIYEEINQAHHKRKIHTRQILHEESRQIFRRWTELNPGITY